MEENKSNLKIAYTKNINNLNFNTTITIPINSNANIKTILNLDSYLFDQRVECGNGKAIISGKIGLKVLYIDTDNMTNTLVESTSFSETYLDDLITADTYLNVCNANVINNVLSHDGSLKINCDVTIAPIAYLNLGLANSIELNDSLITKKREVQTKCISSKVNTSFEYTTNIETKDSISKMLCHQRYLSVEKVLANDGFAVVEGKIFSNVIYETIENEENIIKEIKEVSNFKCDVDMPDLNADDMLDLSFVLDKAEDNTSIEAEDNTNTLITKHCVKVYGVVLKNMSIDVIDDLFSISHEIEISSSVRECTKNMNSFTLTDVVSNEVRLTKEETAIDEIISNLSTVPEITNTYLKDNQVYVEGIVSSCIAYIDENKEYKLKNIEIPFVINTKYNSNSLDCVHHNISVLDCKTKVKRGIVIDVEYSLFISMNIFEKDTCEMVDSFSVGKPVNFGDYDYQIFIAKPQENMWDLCKRIKISPETVAQLNKNLPLIMEGGERIIIKR